MKTPLIILELEKMGLKGEWNNARSLRFDCPDCGRKKKFLYYPDEKGGRCQCVGCNKLWGMYKFLVKIAGYSKKQAWDAKHGTIEADFNQHELMANYQPTFRKRRKSWKTWTKKASEFLRQTNKDIELYSGNFNWLKSNWGITRETAVKARIGFNPSECFIEKRANWGLVEEKKPNGRLKKLWLPSGLVIPKFNPIGNVTRIRFKNVSPKPKYDYQMLAGSNDKPYRLGNRDSKTVVFVEQELDAILVNQELPDVYVVVITNPYRTISKFLASRLSGRTIKTFADLSYPLSNMSAPITVTLIGKYNSLGTAFVHGLNIKKWLEM